MCVRGEVHLFTVTELIIIYPQEIFLQKNGTNQLGITLGYDAKSTAGRLFVCDVSCNM